MPRECVLSCTDSQRRQIALPRQLNKDRVVFKESYKKVKLQICIIRNNKPLEYKFISLVAKIKMECRCVAVRMLTNEELAFP